MSILLQRINQQQLKIFLKSPSKYYFKVSHLKNNIQITQYMNIKLLKNQNTVIIHFTNQHIALRTEFTTKKFLILKSKE